MPKQTQKWLGKLSLGISLKLFIAFWLVIFISVLTSYLVTMQFQHSPTQEQVNLQQLKLLTHYNETLVGKNKIRLKSVQHKFRRKHDQYLLIKNLTTDKVYTPNKRIWGKVKDYLTKHSLDNPVTIDFAFTKVTSSQPIVINNKKYQLFVASEPQRKHLVGWVHQLPLALRIILILAISFICCWFLAKTFTNPLIAIQKASKSLGEGKLSTRISKFDQRSDEFGALARSFNQMAAELENNISAHQRLLGDVSHELRSPLTRLQLAVALAEKNMGNTAEQQKHLNRCETEVDRLDEMIADVLTLSRLEHSQNALDNDDVDLSKLASQVISDCQYFANSKNVTITLKSGVNTTVLADTKMLTSAFSNVINNAVKYSPTDQDVLVVISEQNQYLQLSVSDHGPGVPDDMIEKLFAPFFRVADGRERSSGGTGLGLAIAQQAIQLHHGEITAQNSKPSGLIVTIKLPIKVTRG